ncbi:MAG: O-acetyl-ADP-ribose deacetylase [Chitinophagaceae bacterium]|nr:O-acetyl-ADP-ribose deacetylase [Chitinophagaceae bacterium]
MTSKIAVLKTDITKLHVDAIVNAANTSLMGGGGVDGAIHRAGGPAILEDCRRIVTKQGGCETGEAVITAAGKLPAKYVINTVGPVWRGGKNGEPELLRNAYFNSLQLALQYQVETIAFPNISTGIFGYPKEKAALTAANTVKGFLSNYLQITTVVFVCFDEENFSLYNGILSV